MEIIWTLLLSLLPAAIRSACPVILAAVGEIHSQKSGVMNLGIEGMMMFGAFSAFVTVYSTGSLFLGVAAGMLGGGLLALIHCVLVVRMGIDHILSGIMLGYLGISLADFLGRPYMAKQIPNLEPVQLGALSEIPFIGQVLFRQNPLVYLTLILVLISWVIFKYFHLGSVIVAVGDNPKAADVSGINVLKVRYLSVIYGGLLAGLAGAYMSLNYSSTFISGITAGRGWIAIALVTFSSWRPLVAVLGGLVFGGIETLQFHLSLLKVQVPYHFLMMLPYLVTIIVLVINSKWSIHNKPNAPQGLGHTYKRE